MKLPLTIVCDVDELPTFVALDDLAGALLAQLESLTDDHGITYRNATLSTDIETTP